MKTEYLAIIGNDSILNRFTKYSSSNINRYVVIYVCLVMIGGYFAFPLSFITKTNTLVGFLLLPFTLIYTRKQRYNYLYLGFIIFFEILAFAYHLRIFYFFTLAFFLLFIIELWIGEINKLILFLLAFMSPFFQQITVILGFPIRLQLSALAGNILAIAGLPIKVEGNTMLLNDSAFSVDDACMGLNMLAFSMLMGILAIAHQYYKHKHRVQLSFWKVIQFFLIVFLLDLACNLLRIIILILFNIAPENSMHELTGIICFIIYVMIPLYFISKRMVTKSGKQHLEEHRTFRKGRLAKFCIMALSVIILLTGINVNNSREQLSTIHTTATLDGFNSVSLKDGITKLTNADVLIYTKPIPEFFTGEHTPLMCWKGSGYHFESIKTNTFHEKEIYQGQLIKGNSILYTAWWYSNGSVHTLNQLDWRTRMLKGEDRFCLINVTSESESSLHKTLSTILKENCLDISSN